MKERLSAARKHAFVLRQSDLETLYNLLEKKIGTVTTSAVCSDDVERQFENLGELASYNNPKTKRILILLIESGAPNEEGHAKLDFTENPETHISININVQAKTDSDIKNKVFDTIEGMKPWYSFLAETNNFLTIFIAVGTGLGCVMIAYLAIEKYYVLGNISKISRTFFLLYSSFIIGFIANYVLKGLRKRIFPLGYFALGNGERRYEIAERVRWGIIITLAGSFLSWLVNWVW